MKNLDSKIGQEIIGPQKTFTPKGNQLVFVFDLDNTLVETNRANNCAYKEAILSIVGKDVQMKKGRFTRTHLSLCLPDLNVSQLNTIIRLKEDLYVKYLQETNLNKPLYTILKLIKESGNETILLTESTKTRANQVCDYYALTPLFNKQYFKEDYPKGDKYLFLRTSLPSISSVILFENELSEIRRAIEYGIHKNHIITIKF